MAGESSSILLDEISAEVSQLSDAEIATAAAQIQARAEKARSRVTPESKQKMKDREKRRRLLNAQILKAAKAKGLMSAAEATV